MSILRRTIGWLSAIAGFTLLGWVIYLDGDYAARMPRTADVATGRTVPLSVQHGTHIFVTPAEAQAFARAESRITWGWPLVMLGVGIAGADHLWKKRQKALGEA
jgi:hypothetical protein